MSISSSLALRKALRYSHYGENEKALATLTEAVSKYPNDPRPLLRRGLMTDSCEDFTSSLKIYPSNGVALFFLGLTAFKKDDIVSAREHISRAGEVAPNNLSVKAMSALIKLRRDNDISALREMGRSLTGVTISVRARILMELETGIEIMDHADTGTCEKEETFGGFLGRAFDALDDVAVMVYWLVANIKNQLVNIANSKRRKTNRIILDGMRYDGIGKKEKAAACFEKVLSSDSKNMDALEYMTLYNLGLGDHKKAASYLSRLENVLDKKAEAEPILKKWRADIFLVEKKYEKAMSLYIEILDEFSLDYITPYRTGLCALRLEQYDRAEKYFMSALSRINPGLLNERLEKLVELKDPL